MSEPGHSPAPRKGRQELALSLFLVVLAALAYGHLFESGTVPYSPHSDLLATHLSMKEVARRNLATGDGLPFWKSDMMSGGPALTHPQALYTHPLHLPFLFAAPTAAAGPAFWLHFVAMALSFQVLGAVLGLDVWARAFMSVAGLFACKLVLIAYAGWLPVLPGLVCAPLLIAALLRSLDRPGAGSALGLTLAGGLALHAGHLQIVYYCLLFLSVYAGILCVAWLRQGAARRAGRTVLAVGGAALLAAGGAAYLLLPLAAENPLFSRSETSYEFFLSRGALSPKVLLTLLHPEVLGTPIDGSYPQVELWEDAAYFGLVAEALAVVGMVLGWRRRHTRFFAIGLVFSVLLAFDGVLLRLAFELVPGFALFRHPSRFLFLTTLLGIPLAGIGLHVVMERLAERGLYGRWPGWMAFLLIAALAAEGFYYARRYVLVAPAAAVVPEADFRSFLARDSSVHRVAPLQRFALNYGWAASMGLELVTGFDPYNTRHYRRYFGLMASGEIPAAGAVVWLDLDRVARWDMLDALNARYLISASPLKRVPDGVSLVANFESQPLFVFYRGFSQGSLFVYENRNARPRAHWAAELLPASNLDQALGLVARHDLGHFTVAEGAGPGSKPRGARARAALRVVASGDGRLSLETRSEQRRFAVISEVWHPGWRATLDGEPTALFRTNAALLGTWVPAGSHRVELEFRPLYWTAACSLSALCGLSTLALAAAWIARRRGLRRAAAAPDPLPR